MADPGLRLDLGTLGRSSGAFAMVAIDQRESLRTMLAEARSGAGAGAAADAAGEIPDALLTEVKVAVVRALSPHASAVLIDRQFGLDAVLRARALHPACGLIVAADALVQEPGDVVTDTELDRSMDPGEMRALGAAALKLLVIWRDDERRPARRALVEAFVERAHAAGLVALVEGVVSPPLAADGTAAPAATGWDREAALLEAATELCLPGVDLYKAEVPLFGRAPAREITARAAAITAAVGAPWVVLSQGVRIDDFAPAVEAACRGGASGFLAGRAIWSDCLANPETAAELERIAVPRLRRLAALVDREARPWHRAGPRSPVTPGTGPRRSTTG